MSRLYLSSATGAITINFGLTRIGRRSSSDLVLRDQGASRCHASIFRSENAIILIDHSESGTIINNLVVRNQAQHLNIGDRIKFPPQVMTYILCENVTVLDLEEIEVSTESD